jgi:hypothetical protein
VWNELRSRSLLLFEERKSSGNRNVVLLSVNVASAHTYGNFVCPKHNEKWDECGWAWQCHCVLVAVFFELSTKYLKSGSEIKSCPSTRASSKFKANRMSL